MSPVSRLPRHYRTEVVVEAPIEQVWGVVSDPARVGEWSGECRRITYLDGATGPAVGVRFHGHSQVSWRRWAKPCQILVYDAPHRFAFDTANFADRSTWDFRLTPVGNGTRITQEYRLHYLRPGFDLILATLVPSHRDRSAALHADLVRLGRVARREDDAALTWGVREAVDEPT